MLWLAICDLKGICGKRQGLRTRYRDVREKHISPLKRTLRRSDRISPSLLGNDRPHFFKTIQENIYGPRTDDIAAGMRKFHFAETGKERAGKNDRGAETFSDSLI